MARRRIIDTQAQQGDEPQPQQQQQRGNPLRPRDISEYVGQQDLIEKLKITLQAVKQRNEPMEHVLLHGPPGLGKTTLAYVIAGEMGTRAYTVSGPALTRTGDLLGTLTRLEPHDVLFIDEIHRLPPAVEEYIYPAMEDFRIDVALDTSRKGRVVRIDIKPFTLIGATTRAGLLSAALRNRFGIAHHLRFYTEAELVEILVRSCPRLGLEAIPVAALAVIARRSRGTPRVTLRLLRRVRDFAHVRSGGRIDEAVVAEALALEGVDDLGLDELDRSYLRTIAQTYHGGPAGLEAIAASLSEDPGTLEDVVEPFLLQVGFLARTRQGRKLTPAASRHLGLRFGSLRGAVETTLFGAAAPAPPPAVSPAGPANQKGSAQGTAPRGI